MKIIDQDKTQSAGEIAIRLSGFSDIDSARKCLDQILKPGLRENLTDSEVRPFDLKKDGSDFVVITGVCNFPGPNGENRHYVCHGTGPCVEV